MGLFKKVKDAQAQAQAAMAGAGAGGLPGMAGMDTAGLAAEAQKMQRIANSGVEAPGVIHAIRPSGAVEFGGGQKVDFEVSIRPSGGDPYQTTITQSMLPAQLETLSEGQAITVRYDPDAPAAALIYGW
jgi:hypothetical protein